LAQIISAEAGSWSYVESLAEERKMCPINYRNQAKPTAWPPAKKKTYCLATAAHERTEL
jgi:hypothetical protein